MDPRAAVYGWRATMSVTTEGLVGGIETHSTDDSVDAFVDAIVDETRREDCRTLLELMKRTTGEEPRVWSSGVIGFGTYHYRSSSGQEGDWFPVGFASRKAALTIYLGLELDPLEELLTELGTHRSGKGCIYVKRLDDVDPEVLRQVVKEAYARMRQTFG